MHLGKAAVGSLPPHTTRRRGLLFLYPGSSAPCCQCGHGRDKKRGHCCLSFQDHSSPTHSPKQRQPLNKQLPADIPRRAACKTSASNPLSVPRLAVQLHLLQESPCPSTLSLTAPRRLRQQALNPLHSASHGTADTAFTDTSRALPFQLALRKTIIRSITMSIVASDPAGRHAHPTCQEASETWAALPSPRRTRGMAERALW